MASNTFGSIFQCTTFGESHGAAVGVVIDGCPAGIMLTEDMVNAALARRAPGKTVYTSPRGEQDKARIISGVFEQTTTGAPITILIENRDADSTKYESIRDILRPGHSNMTYLAKYGIFDHRGGGRASARETAARVAAGTVAEAMLKEHGISLFACLAQVGRQKAPGLEEFFPDSQGNISAQGLENICRYLPQSALFAPSAAAEEIFAQTIVNAKDRQDSVGGLVRFFISGVPAGLGDPVYQKLSARLAYALMSIPASKAFEIGQGLASAAYSGSVFNDNFVACASSGETANNTHNHSLGLTGKIGNKYLSNPGYSSDPATSPVPDSSPGLVYPSAGISHPSVASVDGFNSNTADSACESPGNNGIIRLGTNRAGGVLGGISTGDIIYGSVAFKPTSSIGMPQDSLTTEGQSAVFQLPEGSRHDPCVAVRAVPVVEAMCWLVIADAWLMNLSARRKISC